MIKVIIGGTQIIAVVLLLLFVFLPVKYGRIHLKDKKQNVIRLGVPLVLLVAVPFIRSVFHIDSLFIVLALVIILDAIIGYAVVNMRLGDQSKSQKYHDRILMSFQLAIILLIISDSLRIFF